MGPAMDACGGADFLTVAMSSGGTTANGSTNGSSTGGAIGLAVGGCGGSGMIGETPQGLGSKTDSCTGGGDATGGITGRSSCCCFKNGVSSEKGSPSKAGFSYEAGGGVAGGGAFISGVDEGQPKTLPFQKSASEETSLRGAGVGSTIFLEMGGSGGGATGVFMKGVGGGTGEGDGFSTGISFFGGVGSPKPESTLRNSFNTPSIDTLLRGSGVGFCS